MSIKFAGFHFVFEQQINQESQQMAGGPGGRLGPLVGPVGGPGGQSPPEAPRISAFEWASGACIFTYFCIHFYMHYSMLPKKKFLHFQVDFFFCFIFRQNLLLGFFRQNKFFNIPTPHPRLWVVKQQTNIFLRMALYYIFLFYILIFNLFNLSKKKK